MLARAVFTRIPAKVRDRCAGLRKDVSMASGLARRGAAPSSTCVEVTAASAGRPDRQVFANEPNNLSAAMQKTRYRSQKPTACIFADLSRKPRQPGPTMKE